MRHRPRLVSAHLSDRQAEPHGHLFPGAGRAGGLTQAVAQADHGGQLQRQMRECGSQIVGRFGRRNGDGDIERAVRRVRAHSRPDGRSDPRPGIGGEPAAAAGVESVDGCDQAEGARLHRLVEGFAAQTEMVRSQGHEPEALADEILSRAAIARASSHCERAFTSRVKRGLGQQVTRQGIHLISVEVSSIQRVGLMRTCGQGQGGDAVMHQSPYRASCGAAAPGR